MVQGKRRSSVIKKNKSKLHKIPKVKRRPIEHASFSIQKAENGFIASVSGYIPRKTKNGISEDFSDKYIVKSRNEALEILKKAIK